MSKKHQKTAPTKEVQAPTNLTECIICAYPIDGVERLRTLTTCGHEEPICSICYLRIRALQRNFHCPTCKREIDNVICTEVGSTAHFNDFQIWNNNTIDETFVYEPKGQIFFPRDHYYQKIKNIWLYQCSICNQTRRDFKQLRGHMINEHNLHMCNLCGEFKQVFPQEHKKYTQNEYDIHLRKGDKDGSNGHPLCEFCHKRYYDSTALFIHLTKDHFTCHICEQQGIKFKYFGQYHDLEIHFRNAHFLCDDPLCLEKRFIVFKNEIDLFTHRKSFHPHLVLGERHSIPLHFQYRKQDPNATVVNSTGDRVFAALEEKEVEKNTEGSSFVQTELTRKDRFEGGLGGRAFNGEWQVELQPTTRDPRDPNRNIHRDEVPVAPTVEEEFPELMPTSIPAAGGQLINRWISIKDNSGSSKSNKTSSYSNSAQGSSKNKVNDFPSLPAKSAATKPAIQISKKSGLNSGSSKNNNNNDVSKVMNYVNKLAPEENIIESTRPPLVVDSLSNWANVKVDKRLQKKKNNTSNNNNNNKKVDLGEDNFPTLGDESTPESSSSRRSNNNNNSNNNTDTWNSTGVVYSQDEFTYELEKALHESLEEFNDTELKKGTEVSLNQFQKEQDYPSLSGKQNKPIKPSEQSVSTKSNKGNSSSKNNTNASAKKSDDWGSALKSMGFGSTKRPNKTVDVVKPNNAKEANKKLTAGLKKNETLNTVWKDNINREDSKARGPASVSPPPVPSEVLDSTNNSRKYGGWVKLAGAEEDPNEQKPTPVPFENDGDFPSLSGKMKR